MALKSLVTTISGVDWSAIGDPITPDPVIRNGTLWCFDFADEYSYPSQTASEETADLINLVEGGDPASFGSATLAFSGGGLSFGVANNQFITLPDAAKFTGNTGGFCAVYWLKLGTQTQATGGSIAGFYDFGNEDGPFGIELENPVVRFKINGTQVYTESWNGDGDVHAYALAMVNDPDTGWRGRVYKDGVLVADEAVSGTLSTPTVEPTEGPFIGDGGANGTTKFAVFNAYRSYGIDLDGWDLDDLEQLLADDYSDNVGRFS